jgi:hypothetical protein
VRQEAEDEGRRDLIWGVGDADVKVGEFRLHEIADYDFESTLLGPGFILVRRRLAVDRVRRTDGTGRTCPGRAL